MSTGYACPVCDDPQADIGHLANHLAFTAILRNEAHADWLDEHVPAWNEYDEAALSSALADHTDRLEECEYPQVFEDTTGEDGTAPGRDDPGERSGALFDDGHAHDHGQQHGQQHGHGPSGVPEGVETASVPGGELDDEEREAILEEAREMTRELREGDGDAGDPATEGDGDDGTDNEATDDE
ncbi:DUF5810 domain-containing protein [Haloglomus salinum]|uniref:DUF5810 domain-containing protein n=1 Tax=Haloglomus salinum TaxID=2962673 RepID=UPI0020C99993|nr:DUF5810 domain-containing protein [Haloglomus salinum]